MKQRLQGMVMGVLVTVLMLSTMTVFAAAPQTIEVIFGGVRTTLFGQEFVVRDDQGIAIEPITYNNRLYVPVDSILHAMGDNVQWNVETGILNFGVAGTATPPVREAVSLFEAIPAFEGSPSGIIIGTVNMMGQAYANVMNSGSWSGGGWRHHNLNAEFTTLTGIIGRIDGGTQRTGSIRACSHYLIEM